MRYLVSAFFWTLLLAVGLVIAIELLDRVEKEQR